jgi:hypothetical protein
VHFFSDGGSDCGPDTVSTVTSYIVPNVESDTVSYPVADHIVAHAFA